MTGQSLFGRVIEYHVIHNLSNVLENEIIEEGKLYFQKKKERIPVKVGEEQKLEGYNGFLLLSNGEDIIDHLRKAGVILLDGKNSFVSLKDENDLFSYLNKNAKEEGIFIYDSASKEITREKLDSKYNLEGMISAQMFPDEFLSEDGYVPLLDENGKSRVGCRSSLGAQTSKGFNDSDGNHHAIDGYHIKNTSYNELGLGPVVHYSKNRIGMFYFKYAPESKGPFIDEEYKIIGMYKTYECIDGRFIKISEEAVHFNNENRLAYNDTSELVFSENKLLNKNMGYDKRLVENLLYNSELGIKTQERLFIT